MPRLHKNRTKEGYHVKANLNGVVITFQVNDRGVRWFRSAGYRDKTLFSRSRFRELYDRGYFYTFGSGPSMDHSDHFSPIDPRDLRKAEVLRMRSRAASFRKTLQSTYSRSRDATRFCRLITDTIRTAHAANPATWAVRLTPSRSVPIVVAVGGLQVFRLSKEGDVTVLVHRPWLSDGAIADLCNRKSLGATGFSEIRPKAAEATLQPDRFGTWYREHIANAHYHVVRSMAYMADANPFASSHSPGVIRYLAKLGYPVTQPA